MYIGSVCTNHYEMATMFLQHGKHVLCEKPLTLSSRDTIALIEVSASGTVHTGRAGLFQLMQPKV